MLLDSIDLATRPPMRRRRESGRTTTLWTTRGNRGTSSSRTRSSWSTTTLAAVGRVLGEGGAGEEDEATKDKINQIMESRKLLTNASYFAFTATPKNKTLEIFYRLVKTVEGVPEFDTQRANKKG